MYYIKERAMKRAVSLFIVMSVINSWNAYLGWENTRRIEELEHRFQESEPLSVTATMYNPVEDQCDKDPLVTAGMYRIDPDRASHHRWIAVSRDLLKRWGGRFDYGDKVVIKGAGHKDGTYTIVDTMNKRFTNRIDFLETRGTRRYKYENVQLASI